MKLPSKVIIYKNTPFIKEEIIGIKQALSSINRIELLYLQQDSPFRAIRLNDHNKMQGHNYPVTKVQL